MTTKSATAIKERVEAGAKWLDRVDPTWIDRINLKTLELRSGCSCVLGQIVNSKVPDADLSFDSVVADTESRYFRETVKGQKSDLPHGVKGLVITLNRARRLGFHTADESSDPGEWDGLNRAWKRLIKARRAVQA